MMPCAMIRDLLPLYAEGLTGEETNRYIEAHLTTCAACAGELERLRTPIEQPEPRAADWKRAMQKNRSRSRRKLLLAVLAALLLGLGICLGFLYQQEFFAIRARKAAPQGGYTAVMYQGSRGYASPGQEEGFRIRLKQKGDAQQEVVFNDAEYLGMYWSPDGRFLAVNYRHEGVSKLCIIDTAAAIQDTFSTVLDGLVKQYSGLSWVRWQGDTPLLDCTFVYWSQDSSSILVSAGGTDADGVSHQGYFWYHPTGTQLPITGLTAFDGISREAQAQVWADRVEAFRQWGKQQNLIVSDLITGEDSVLARLLAGKAEDCSVIYYQYRAEADDFAPCDPTAAWTRLQDSAGDYGFAAFAHGEVLSDEPGDMICEKLYIVVFE